MASSLSVHPSPFDVESFSSIPPSSSSSQAVRRKVIRRNSEQLWKSLFMYPSNWWDHRSDKKNPRYPDFKHKQTQESLWVKDPMIPQWVTTKLATLSAGAVPPSAFSWSVRIMKHVSNGQYQRAVALFKSMQRQGAKPDKYTFVAVLKACANSGDLEGGRHTHAQILRRGCELEVFVGNSLINMYAKCGSMPEACRVFVGMATCDIVSWNAMIMGYVKCEMPSMAIQLYQQMQHQNIKPDAFTFSGVLDACASLEALDHGKLVHERVTTLGLQHNPHVGSRLVDMYAKCGQLADAYEIFNSLPNRDAVSWSAVILGYSKLGQHERALALFHQMHREGINPNRTVLVSVLNACSSIVALEEGMFIHAKAIKRGLASDAFVASSLVSMYAKCRSMEDACRVFNNMPMRDVVSWTALIGGYAKCGLGWKTLEVFQHMQRDLVQPDSITFVGLLNACASVGALEEGKQLHRKIIDIGVESNVFVRSSLVDMYAKCGCIDEAYKVFKKFEVQDTVLWNAMILGFVKGGKGEDALELLWRMRQEQVMPDKITFVGVLKACASVAAFHEGRLVHAQVIRKKLEDDVLVGSCLIDMYAKCGSIVDACRVFNNMPIRNIVNWSSMMMGYAVHGLGKQALQLFQKMCEEDIGSDAGIFVGLLWACIHAGLVDQGGYFFESMSPLYGVQATVEHYTCVVDLLGRSGYLIEAEDAITQMPYKPDCSIWVTLLGSCRYHGNVKMGEHVAQHIFRFYPENASGYVLLSNVYAAASG